MPTNAVATYDKTSQQMYRRTRNGVHLCRAALPLWPGIRRDDRAAMSVMPPSKDTCSSGKTAHHNILASIIYKCGSCAG
jgi:hypothetical protein